MNRMKKYFFAGLFLIAAAAFAQESAQDAAQGAAQQAEDTRLATIRFGTEVEIGALIQSLREENVDYLDNEIIALVENTRNQRILSGAFSFFGDRERSGLENRAMRAIDERDSEENETVLSAINYLGAMRDNRAVPYLKDILDNEERRFMGAAFRALGRVGGSGGWESDDVADYLIDFYSNRSPADEHRRDILLAIGATGSSAGIGLLSEVAMDDGERGPLRMAAMEALAAIGDPDGLDAILSGLAARDAHVRSAAVGALGPFSGDAVDRAILDGFRDSFFRTRIASAQASRRRQLAAAVPYLRFRAMNDSEAVVREEAIRALGGIGNAEAMLVLEELFSNRRNSARVRIVAAEMLMQNEPEKHLDSFIVEMDEASRTNHTALYNGFIRIIGTTTSPGMEDLARRLLQHRGIVERSTALDIAANNNIVALADEIRVVAEDRNESLARRARRTLERMGVEL